MISGYVCDFMQENDNEEFKKIDMHIILFSISANLKNDG